jgi:hypothetical protein
MRNTRTPMVVAGVLVAFFAVAAVGAIGGEALTGPKEPAELWIKDGAASSRPEDRIIAESPGGAPADSAHVLFDDATGAPPGVWFSPRRSHVGEMLQRLVRGRGAAVEDAAHFARTEETREAAGVAWRRYAADGATAMK